MRLRVAIAVLLLGACAAAAQAAVQIVVGPTPIPRAGAHGAGDITVINERLAFALAVDSAAPYGVPRGALVALAPVRDGAIGRNRVVFADFIPNNWSAWPNRSHQVEILERGPAQVRIRATRDFGAATVTTLYTLAAGADSIHVVTTLSNGGTQPLTDLLSGLTLWPNSGFLFPVPGLASNADGSARGAFAPRVVAYDEDWSIALHAPYLDTVGSDSRDLLLRHTLAPGESRTFEGWLQVGTRGDLAPVVASEIARAALPAGSVHGAIAAADGRPVTDPAVVVERDGKPYAWTLAADDGRYRMALPAGAYVLYATGRGTSRSRAIPVTVTAGGEQAVDFAGLEPPGQAAFDVADARSGAPLDARLEVIAGEQPLVGFLGRRTFFTGLERRGHAALTLAPGDYRFAVSHGGGFLAAAQEVALHVAPGASLQRRVRITPLFDPPARGWYAADLHHHADQAEAVTPPADLVRAQLAAGLDVLFVSDHDSNANHAALASLAAACGVPFVPGIELSPSWGHFNAYPITPGMQLAIDTSTADVHAVLREARREGATVVQVNHPYIPYGYFTSVDGGVAPGGYDPGFDLVEINGSQPQDDARVLERTWTYWNQGERHYLTAGSDTHDVWNEISGRVRVYVHPEGPLTAQSFVAALAAGHAYVTHGPLIYPAVMFGARQPETAATASFDLASVAGLKEARLVSDGAVVATRAFTGAPRTAHVEFRLPPGHRWYALVAEDRAGAGAYSDPVWIGAPP